MAENSTRKRVFSHNNHRQVLAVSDSCFEDFRLKFLLFNCIFIIFDKNSFKHHKVHLDVKGSQVGASDIGCLYHYVLRFVILK